MANQYTAKPIPNGVRELYEGGATQTEIAERHGVSQKMVFGWFKKLGIKSRVAKKRNQWNENNTSWKGKDAGYASIHYWVEKRLGKANKCIYCGVSKTYRGSVEWANIGHKYERDLNQWVQLCRKHHRQMDKGNLDILNYLRGLEVSD